MSFRACVKAFVETFVSVPIQISVTISVAGYATISVKISAQISVGIPVMGHATISVKISARIPVKISIKTSARISVKISGIASIASESKDQNAETSGCSSRASSRLAVIEHESPITRDPKDPRTEEEDPAPPACLKSTED